MRCFGIFRNGSLLTISILLTMLMNTAYGELTLRKDRLFIKFIDGSEIIRNKDSNNIMKVNIASIDDLAVKHEVVYFKKLGRDYSDSTTYAMYYYVFFDGLRENIADIEEEFNDDPNIEFARMMYDDDENVLEWVPDDFFYNFAPVTNNEWPCDYSSGVPQPQCEGENVFWGEAYVELWPLHNDGEIYARNDYEYCNYYEKGRPSATAGEDIKAFEAWDYYLDNTLDPNGIPGDPSVIIGLMDTGVDYDNPEIQAGLWYNPLEDHGDPEDFDPEHTWDDPLNPGDIGSPTWDDGYPGLEGIDDDQDGAADWFDRAVLEIISDYADNDNDFGIECPPGSGYIRDGSEDEPHVDHPPHYMCDCPHTLIGIVDPSDPQGRTFTANDLGVEGVDDDCDGFIDECDGAIWDDDENGYVDDVIGWDFGANDRNGDNDPTPIQYENPNTFNYHGTKMFGYSAANANNTDPQSQQAPSCDNFSVLDDNYDRVRVGMVGVCPDCRIAALKGTVGIEGILYGHLHDIKVFVQAGMWNYNELPETQRIAFDLGGFWIGGTGNNFCVKNDEVLYEPDKPHVLEIAGTSPSGGCNQGTPMLMVDLTVPAYPLTSTRRLRGLDPWYTSSIGFIGSGTSSAMQFAAGAAGLLYSFNPNWTNEEVLTRLIYGTEKYREGYHPEYSRNYNGPDWKPVGIGRLDVERALRGTGPLSEPKLSVLDAVVDQDEGPGNQDGVVSQGESVGIGIKLFNYGNTIEDLLLTLTSNDPYVNIIASQIVGGEIPYWDSIETQGLPFVVSISPDAPIGRIIPFDLILEGGNITTGIIEGAVRITVSAKELYTINNVFPESCFPVVCELDGDPYPEIVYTTSSYTKAINAEDGSLIWSNEWHPRIPNTVTQPHSPSAGDIDGDGFVEVVLMGINMSGTHAIAAIDNDGQTLATFDFDFPSEPYYRQPLVLADWDSDGKLDIIAVVNSGSPNIQIIGYNESSGSLEEIHFIHFPGINGINGIATADLNNDHRIDLILSTGYYNSLCIYDNSTQEITYDGLEIGSYSPPVVADVDNDSWLEIIYKIDSNPTQVRLVNIEDDPISNILLMETDPDYEIGNSNFSVGDWDNNDILEIFFKSYKFEVEDPPTKIHVYNYNGMGEDFIIYRFTGTSFLMQSEILIADLNTDFQSDLIFRGKNYGREIWGLKGGSTAAGQGIWDEEYQRILSADFASEYTTPIIQDMDLDGDIDIFVNTPKNHDASFNGTLELFSTGGEDYDGALQWPQYRHDARRTGLYAQTVTSLDVTSDMTIWDNLVVWQGITIAEDATLTIRPGVSIKMKPGTSIEVLGSLVAEGNPSQPISFTGVNPSPGSWTGIMVMAPNANVDLKNCIIKHGRYGIIIEGADYATIDIDSTTISDFEDIGIMAGGAEVRITNSEIKSNANMGIYNFSGLLYAENNIVFGVYLNGIRVEDSPGIIGGGPSEIIGNVVGLDEVTFIGSIGIYCDACELLRCYDNNVYNFHQAGIRLSDGIYEVEENIINDIEFNGLTFSHFAQSEVVFRNQISDTEIGVWCEDNSYPVLGLDEENFWGYNSFIDFKKYGVHNYDAEEEIFAQRNWWGAPECPDFDSPVVCEPPLEENPHGKTVVDDPTLPKEFMLHQNYPNPFNSNTIIRFDLPTKSDVTIRVYNILGQLVNTLVDQDVNAGYQSIVWDGKNIAGKSVASGIYLYNIVASDYRSSRKMTILK